MTAVESAEFVATHVVPAAGLLAWVEPDPAPNPRHARRRRRAARRRRVGRLGPGRGGQRLGGLGRRSRPPAPLTASPEGDLDALHAKLDGLAARVEELTERSGASAAGAPASRASTSPDDDVWRRLGLTEGERRTVTVVFADVTGFTALSETLDPEAMQLVMRDTMSLLAECVQAEGGTVEKFIGDALCAIFGAPVAHVDEPERAARACLAMHERLAERASTRPDLPPLTVHVGINTGPVIAGAVGDGTPVRRDGRHHQHRGPAHGPRRRRARPSSPAATARRLRRWFRLEDAGLHEVKGKAEPLAVVALARRAVRGGARRTSAGCRRRSSAATTSSRRSATSPTAPARATGRW